MKEVIRINNHKVGTIIKICATIILFVSLLFLFFTNLFDSIVEDLKVYEQILFALVFASCFANFIILRKTFKDYKNPSISINGKKILYIMTLIFDIIEILTAIIISILFYTYYLYLVFDTIALILIIISAVEYFINYKKYTSKESYEIYLKEKSKGFETTNFKKQDLVNLFVEIVVVIVVTIFFANFKSSLIKFSNHFEGTYKTMIFEGLRNTMIIAVSGLLIGIFLGIIIGITKASPSKNVFVLIFKKICDIYVAIFRGTPMFVQLLILYFVILTFTSNSLVIAIVGFGLNSGAYVSEIIRGGIISIPEGQVEAATSLGLTHKQAMSKVIIPQSVKNILPALGNEFISLLKDTSIVSFIGALDLTKAFRQIASATYVYDSTYIILGISYFVIVYIVTKLLNLLERSLHKND